MNISDNPRIPGPCSECAERFARSFDNLPEAEFTQLLSLKVCNDHPRGTTLFMEGQPPSGVFLLCSGRVKLSTYSEEGKAIILRIAEPGELLGLSANLAGHAHTTTAYAIERCHVAFIKHREFLDFIQNSLNASLSALRQLNSSYLRAHQQICALGLSMSAAEKLVRLILQWCDNSANGGPVRISQTHTHGDIAEMIGTSRETVTRLLKDFRNRGLITLSKSELCVPDRVRLHASIGAKHRNGNGHL